MSKASLNILLVEDSKTDAILTERLLTHAPSDNFLVHQASSLESGLKVLKEQKQDVILLDLFLPDTAGLSGLHSIQNMAPELPIIILTSQLDEATALSAVQQGAQDYLFKDHMDSQAISKAIRFAIERKNFESVLITRANFDPLTGLANRTLFESRLDIVLARSKRTGEGIGVFFLDLDLFKQVNDTYGHAVGDSVLQEVGRRLKKSIRPYDTAARFGGDEFALLIEGIKEEQNCESIAQKIINVVSQPFHVAGHEFILSMSIGITTCMKGAPLSRESLMQCADKAMYVAKSESRKNAYRFYGAAA